MRALRQREVETTTGIPQELLDGESGWHTASLILGYGAARSIDIFLCDRHAYDGICRGGSMSQRLRDVVLLVAAGLFAGSLSG